MVSTQSQRINAIVTVSDSEKFFWGLCNGIIHVSQQFLAIHQAVWMPFTMQDTLQFAYYPPKFCLIGLVWFFLMRRETEKLQPAQGR